MDRLSRSFQALASHGEGPQPHCRTAGSSFDTGPILPESIPVAHALHHYHPRRQPTSDAALH
jgi:hypothetical protein